MDSVIQQFFTLILRKISKKINNKTGLQLIVNVYFVLFFFFNFQQKNALCIHIFHVVCFTYLFMNENSCIKIFKSFKLSIIIFNRENN